jgi:hypothetical protein
MMLVVAVTGCASPLGTTTTVVAGTIEGIVTAGPTCPVASQPPDPGCADRPVPGALLLVVDVDGETAAEVVSGDDGRFRVSVAPGEYTFVPQPVEGLLGTAQPQDVVVTGGAVIVLDVGYDTGIR